MAVGGFPCQDRGVSHGVDAGPASGWEDLPGPGQRANRRLSIVLAVIVVLAVARPVARQLGERSGGQLTGLGTTQLTGLTPAPADLIIAADSAGPGRLTLAPHEAVIASNNAKITLHASGVVRDASAGTHRWAAPPGHQLLAFVLRFGAGENSYVPLTNLVVGVSVDGAAPRPLPVSSEDTNTAGQLFVVALRGAATRAELMLTSGGLTQRLDLRSGQPGRGNIAFLRHGVGRVLGAARGRTTATVTSAVTFAARLHIELEGAWMYFFLPLSSDRHTRPVFYIHPRDPGHVFLEPDLCYTSPDFTDARTCHVFRTTDVTVTPTGGRPVKGRVLVPGDERPIFEVPAGTTTGTITVSGSEAGAGFRMVITRKLVLPFRLQAERG
jgi:hypothetical protein